MVVYDLNNSVLYTVVLCACCCWLVFFFLFRIRPSPRSTLFPYTTLFRSHPDFLVAMLYTEILWGVPFETKAIDRKSTRLNSSHVAISYAVFCLKKKSSRISRE